MANNTLFRELITFHFWLFLAMMQAFTCTSCSLQEAHQWVRHGTHSLCKVESEQPHNQVILTSGVCTVASQWPPKHLYTLKANDIILGALITMASPAPPTTSLRRPTYLYLPNQLKQSIKSLNIYILIRYSGTCLNLKTSVPDSTHSGLLMWQHLLWAG